MLKLKVVMQLKTARSASLIILAQITKYIITKLQSEINTICSMCDYNMIFICLTQLNIIAHITQKTSQLSYGIAC